MVVGGDGDGDAVEPEWEWEGPWEWAKRSMGGDVRLGGDD